VTFVQTEALKDALNEDAEFLLAARYWDASVRLGIGEAPLCVRIAQGRVAEVRASEGADPVDISIDGSEAEWQRLLASAPQPFYQSLYGASVHHDISLGGDSLDLFAYLGALTRMIDVMRAKAGIGLAAPSASGS
jgi:hypothetical protein